MYGFMCKKSVLSLKQQKLSRTILLFLKACMSNFMSCNYVNYHGFFIFMAFNTIKLSKLPLYSPKPKFRLKILIFNKNSKTINK